MPFVLLAFNLELQQRGSRSFGKPSHKYRGDVKKEKANEATTSLRRDGVKQKQEMKNPALNAGFLVDLVGREKEKMGARAVKFSILWSNTFRRRERRGPY